MYPGSLKSTRYLLVTEFEDRSAFYGPSFFRLCYKPTKFSEVSASGIERRREMDEIRTEWLMTLPRIPVFLTALEINLPNGSFLKNFLYTKHHNLLFAGVYCDEKRVYFENSDNTLTQFGRFMLLINHQNVCKNVYFTPLNQTLLKGEIDSSRRAVSV